MAKKKPQRRVYVRNAPNWEEIEHEEILGSPNFEYLVSMVNPVDKRLYTVVARGNRVYVAEPLPVGEYLDNGRHFKYFAEGYIDPTDEKELNFEGEDATYYRSHTPGGVAVKGKGYGYLLYSALAILAYGRNKYSGGVFSELSQRSADATRWWNAQVQQGYASEDRVSAYSTARIEIDVGREIRENLDSYLDYFDDIDTSGDLEIYEISPEAVDVEVMVEGLTEVQYLPAKKVAQEGLVIGWASNDARLDELFEDAKFPSVEVLSELNLDTVQDIEEVKTLWGLIDEDPDATDAQRERIIHSLDRDFFLAHQQELIDMVGKQLKLPLVANRREPKPKYSKAWKEYFGDLAVIDPEVM